MSARRDNDDGDATPVSKKMSALRGPSLTRRQKKVIAEFMARSPTRDKEFEDGFATAVEYSRDEENFERAIFRHRKRELANNMKKLERKITSAKKQAYSLKYAGVATECLKYFHEHGADNIQALIRHLQTLFPKFKGRDRALRDFITKTFDWKGKPGRKPGKTP